MINSSAEVIVIVFLGGTRGNFVRNCLTFSDKTADASLHTSNYDTRLKIYKKAVNKSPAEIQKHPWGPGHAYDDDLSNYADERFDDASPAERYILCGHLYQIPQESVNDIITEAIVPFTKKFVFITLSKDEIHLFQNTTKNTCDANEANIYCDFDYITQFVNGAEWYNLPYKDILEKDKFLEHCLNIDEKCNISIISDYYNSYHSNCIINSPRMVGA